MASIQLMTRPCSAPANLLSATPDHSISGLTWRLFVGPLYTELSPVVPVHAANKPETLLNWRLAATANPGCDPVSRRVLRFPGGSHPRSEEHTSELQSRLHLVCRLLLEKKKAKKT